MDWAIRRKPDSTDASTTVFPEATGTPAAFCPPAALSVLGRRVRDRDHSARPGTPGAGRARGRRRRRRRLPAVTVVVFYLAVSVLYIVEPLRHIPARIRRPSQPR